MNNRKITTTAKLKLTDWQSGQVVIVDWSAIRSVKRLRATSQDGIELGERTAIETDRNWLRVRETPKEIIEMVEGKK